MFLILLIHGTNMKIFLIVFLFSVAADCTDVMSHPLCFFNALLKLLMFLRQPDNKQQWVYPAGITMFAVSEICLY